MIIIQDKLLSDDIFNVNFICNLKACKGACCWEGDSGAPLEEEELDILDDIYEKVKPFLSPESNSAIEEIGKYTYYKEAEEYGTTLLENGACVFMTFEKGSAKCGIEAAYEAGVIPFKKPISCHLYPIRVTTNKENGFEALNYDEWEICRSACELGKKQQVPVYQFLKEAIIRKYGVAFYEEMEALGSYLKKENK